MQEAKKRSALLLREVFIVGLVAANGASTSFGRVTMEVSSTKPLTGLEIHSAGITTTLRRKRQIGNTFEICPSSVASKGGQPHGDVERFHVGRARPARRYSSNDRKTAERRVAKVLASLGQTPAPSSLLLTPMLRNPNPKGFIDHSERRVGIFFASMPCYGPRAIGFRSEVSDLI